MSVVINFHNEVRNIDMAPLALTKQTYRFFEVILVDDGSTDETATAILDRYGDLLPNIKLIKIEKPLGLRPARNLGVKNSRGDIIITLDLHTTFDCNFLEKIVREFSNDEKIGAVGSLILPYGDRWFICGMRAVEKILFKIRKKIKKYNYVYGTAAAYNAKALKEIDYLSTGKLVEDVDASWRLTKSGWKILNIEENVVFHKGSYDSFKEFLSKLFSAGVRMAFLLSKYKDRIIYPQSLMRIMLPLIILLLLTSPFILLLLMINYFLGLTSVFIKICKENIKNSLIGTIIFLLLIFFSSIGLYYGFIAIVTGKDLHVD